MDQIGIERLKKSFTVVAKVVKAVDNALEDGKISMTEGIGIAFKSVDLIGVMKSLKEAGNELADMDADELPELVAHFKKEFDLNNEDAEMAIEAIIELVLELLWSMDALKNLKTK